MKGISFDNIHSFHDLNLVLSKISIPPATAKTNLVDIPGGNGSVDLTEALGDVKFKDRDCEFTFTVFPSDDFEEKKREISNFLNGRHCKIIVDKDPDYYWEGRCGVNQYSSNKRLNQIVIKATVSPYKLKLNQTRTVIQAGEAVLGHLWNSRKKVVPTITTAAPATIFYGDGEFHLNAGTHRILNITLTEGDNQVVVTSNANVEFTYQEGDL